ncbi:hypothetical protein PG993_014006 [Apiospora rasikravindrae]|uniref:Uncharacterized protein n=1 Tax=Apiospora rasikravindrae TaxID=990691 RepID=A0ABR1RRT6_9PEZI
MARKLWKTIVDIAALLDAEGGDIDWTLFRVGFLGDGPCMKVVEGYVGDGTVRMYVRRADVAKWTLAQAGRDTPGFVRERPGIPSVKA